jgi:hypothetical protein
MDIKTKYGWQELYAIALLETDWSTIDEKIQVAEKGIRVRLHEFYEPRRDARRKSSHRGCSERTQHFAERCCGVAGIEAYVLENGRSL